MPSARLFTRLDELKAGDLFFVDTPAQSLAYEVTDIQVVEPEDTGVLDPVPGQDLVSLVTCTPYGINTHRLVVTGRRTTSRWSNRRTPAFWIRCRGRTWYRW